ncbi:SRPBCC domain-containing protein [Aerococcaceae bacterium DSM 111176]|nr:SRPBCC domain-containing protein [Aerococcaceae bacterium DSM 111176]
MNEHNDHHHHDHEGHDHSHHGHDHGPDFDGLDHNHGREVTLEAEIEAGIDQIWSVLTDNVKIKEWFNELHINDLKPGGSISFLLQDEEIARYLITDLEEPHTFGFTWGEDGDSIVNFELEEIESGKTLLKFSEWVPEVTAHTVKDITGWYVCMEVIGQIVEGREPINRPQHFTKAFTEIEALLADDLA